MNGEKKNSLYIKQKWEEPNGELAETFVENYREFHSFSDTPVFNGVRSDRDHGGAERCRFFQSVH